MRAKKLLSYPKRAAVAYMLFTVFLFVFGPIKWKVPSYPKLLAFLLVYIAAFALGYTFQQKRRIELTGIDVLEPICNPNSKDFGFLKKLPFEKVALAFIVSCTYSIVRGIIIINHMAAVVDFAALLRFDLAVAYFDRLNAEPWGTWYILFLSIIYVFELFWYVLGILYFKKMNIVYKMLFFLTLSVNFVLNLMMGEMIRWGIFVFRLIPIILLSVYVMLSSAKEKSKEEKSNEEKSKLKRNKRLLLIAIALIIAFLLLFTYMQESRSDYLGYDELSYDDRANLPRFIEEERPWPILNSIIYPMDFYITQGYCAMGYALELPPEFTYGIGHSRDLVNYLLNYAGIDLTDDIYPQRLEDATGWPNGMFWPSAFTWLASDWTFYGIPIFMFIFGMFFCNVWYAALFENSITAVMLTSWLWVGIFFISANNQLFQSFEMCMGTIVLILMYALRKVLPRFVL